MNAASASARRRGALAEARGALVVLLIALYRLARCALAALGLAYWIGSGWAIGAVLIVVLMRWNVLLQIAAFVTLVHWWHWPVLAAAVCVAPRLVMILPGLVTTWLATLRHPRPRWNSPIPIEHSAGASSAPGSSIGSGF